MSFNFPHRQWHSWFSQVSGSPKGGVTQLASDIVTWQTGSKLQWNAPGHLLPKAGGVTCERCGFGFWHWSVTWGVKKLMENVLEFVEELHTRVRRVEQLGWKQHVLTFGVLPPNAVLCLDMRSRNPVQLEDIWYLGFATGFLAISAPGLRGTFPLPKTSQLFRCNFCGANRDIWDVKTAISFVKRPNFNGLENLWEWITKLATCRFASQC